MYIIDRMKRQKSSITSYILVLTLVMNKVCFCIKPHWGLFVQSINDDYDKYLWFFNGTKALFTVLYFVVCLLTCCFSQNSLGNEHVVFRQHAHTLHYQVGTVSSASDFTGCKFYFPMENSKVTTNLNHFYENSKI